MHVHQESIIISLKCTIAKLHSSQSSSAQGLPSSPVVEDDQNGKKDLHVFLESHFRDLGDGHTGSTATLNVARKRGNRSSRVPPEQGGKMKWGA